MRGAADPDNAAVAPDGSFAILAEPAGGSDVAQPVTLYAADGEPVRTYELPERDILDRT